MRTSFLSQGRETLLNLRIATARRTSASNQISSGLRVRRPSDGPSDAPGIVRTRSELASIGKFERNLGSVQAELRAVDGTLFNAVNVLQRALQLATQGANGTQTAESRALISKEVEGLFRHLVSLANTVHGGRRVFAGTADSEAPFVLDETVPDGVRYVGNSVSRSVGFPDGRPAQVSLTGDALFLTPDAFLGTGRSAATAGLPPSPPVGLGISFRGEVDGVISVDLPGFFVAAAPPAGAAAGDVVSVNITSADGTLNETIATQPLTGGENATQIAALLNAEIALSDNLDGVVDFSDEGGSLKLTLSDTFGQTVDFSSTTIGSATTGLEGGGTVGGYSAGEIVAALNAAVTADPTLSGARIRFEAVDGEVRVDGDRDFTFTAVDFSRGTAFASGLGGVHRVGGANSANVLGSVHQLLLNLRANDEAGVASSVEALQRASDHVSGAQSFYGSTLRQINITLENLASLETVNAERLSLLQDADLVEAIGQLQAATSAEQFILQVAARQQPTLLDVLG